MIPYHLFTIVAGPCRVVFYLSRSGIGSNDPLAAEQGKAINFFRLALICFIFYSSLFFFGEFQQLAVLSILNSVNGIANDSGLNFRQVTSTISGKCIDICLLLLIRVGLMCSMIHGLDVVNIDTDGLFREQSR